MLNVKGERNGGGKEGKDERRGKQDEGLKDGEEGRRSEARREIERGRVRLKDVKRDRMRKVRLDVGKGR